MKQQLLFTLLSAIVHSSLGSEQSCEYDIFCEVGGGREASHCHYAIPNTGDPQTGEDELTLDHLVRDVLHNCVREGANDNVDFQLFDMEPEGGRQLRAKAIPEERLLGVNDQCNVCCCSQPACMIQGVCCSTNCNTQACERRLNDETDTNATGYLQLVEEAPTSDVNLVLSTLCTRSVRALAELFGWNNRCLGANPSKVECTVTKHCVTDK
jgi:hypothetical protein